MRDHRDLNKWFSLYNLAEDGASIKQQQQQFWYVPILLEPEESIIHRVFDILAVIMEQKRVQQAIWNKQTTLVSFISELALFVPPPLNYPTFPCGVPSVDLQQRVLHMTALYLNHTLAMNALGGLDQLLYLVWTGNGGSVPPETDNDSSDKSLLTARLKFSQSALHVIHRSLPTKQAHELLYHALAPPPTEDDPQQQQHFDVIPKLLNTVFENVQSTPAVVNGQQRRQRKVFLSGLLSALSPFVTDEASQSALLRLTSVMEEERNKGMNHKTMIRLLLNHNHHQWFH